MKFINTLMANLIRRDLALVRKICYAAAANKLYMLYILIYSLSDALISVFVKSIHLFTFMQN